MLRLVFTANDFASTQFLAQPAPALEVKFAARALRQGISTPWGERWRCRALAASPTSSVSVRTLTSHFTWSISPTMIAADLDESLEAAPRLGARQLRAELEQFRSCPNVGVPAFIRYFLDGDRDATLSLCRGMRDLYTTVLEPYWPDIRSNHHSELVRRRRLVADRGLRTALTATIPGSRWSGNCLEIDTPQERTVCLAGRGVVLTPVVFWTGPPLVGELGDQPVVLAYPAPAELTFRVGSESDTLAAILGSTRAAVLRLSSDIATNPRYQSSVGVRTHFGAAGGSPGGQPPRRQSRRTPRHRSRRRPARCEPPLARREVSAVPETIAQRRRRVAVSGEGRCRKGGSWFRMS